MLEFDETCEAGLMEILHGKRKEQRILILSLKMKNQIWANLTARGRFGSFPRGHDPIIGMTFESLSAPPL